VVDRRLALPIEVAIVGRDDDATHELIRAAHGLFLRNLTIAGRIDETPVPGVPVLADRGLIDGRPAAYVCRAYACRLPVSTADAVATELNDAASA
jgi:uncharacterized protein YyaL (SSP411 family)